VRVVDASVVVDALIGDGSRGLAARAAIAHVDLMVAPEHVKAECAQGIRRAWRTGTVSDRRATAALRSLALLAVATVPVAHLLGRAWELRHNLTATDALYVALAEQLGLPLVTTDLRIGRAAGVRCPVVHP
jgi:predicted nucleic acid-binding protein